MTRGAIKLENFFYPVLWYLVPFLQNVKETGKRLAFQRVCFAKYLQKHASLDLLIFWGFLQLPREKMALDYFQ